MVSLFKTIHSFKIIPKYSFQKKFHLKKEKQGNPNLQKKIYVPPKERDFYYIRNNQQQQHRQQSSHWRLT